MKKGNSLFDKVSKENQKALKALEKDDFRKAKDNNCVVPQKSVKSTRAPKSSIDQDGFK